MSYILKKSIITFTFCLFAVITPTLLFGQEKYAKEYEKQGDKAFAQGYYQQALEYYTLGRKFLRQNITLMFKCGETCLKMNNYDKAEYWYQKVLIENDTININKTFPLLYLHLAQSAICNGNLIQAQSFLNTCLFDCDDIEIRKECKKELENIDWIIANNTPLEFNITNLGKNINNETSQFNTFVFRDSILIFTAPTYKKKTTKKETYYTDIYNQIHFSYIDDNYYTPYKLLDWGQINKKKTNVSDFYLDTTTFTAYFTYTTTKNKQNISQIYYSSYDLSSNKWSKPKIFKPLEDKEYSYSHPVIVRQKTECLMYFSSNCKGGFGGMDIWFIDMLNPDAKPINCGGTINTVGNEITPFYDVAQGELYFSSDTHKGFGGFDIFRSKGQKQRWQIVENLLKPINSPANDLYPFISEADEEGYFTSNRPSENNVDNKTCCNDIYRFNRKLPIVPTMQQIVEVKKDEFNPAFDLPIILYFHNDSPDANSTSLVTQSSYADCYNLYRSLSNQYKVNRTRGLDDSIAQEQLSDIDNFMENKLKKNYDKLNRALDYMIDKLQKGNKLTIQIRGYCSSLFETDYNFKLAERRIVSLENYMRTYKNGILSKYMETKDKDDRYLLEIEHLAIGKLESLSPNPTTMEEKRQSIYLPQAMEERRIEIKVIRIRN
ncbi:MAG: hypothetical protein ACTTJH_04580 [Bacteroidales bacterium]